MNFNKKVLSSLLLVLMLLTSSIGLVATVAGVPSLSVSPNPVTVSSVTNVDGNGLTAGTRTRLLLDGSGSSQNTFRTRIDGSFRVGILVASTPRTQTLIAQQQLGGSWITVVQTTITVIALSPTPTPVPSPTPTATPTSVPTPTPSPTPPAIGFVTKSGPNLLLNGQPFRIVGPNTYWLGLDENSSGSIGGIHYPTKYNIDDALSTAKEMGANTVRAHTLGISVGCPQCLEPSLNSFNNQAFNTIDYAIYAAGQKGLKLIIPLTDGNTCFYHGCAQTFVDWTPGGGSFFTTTAVINNFKTYISYLLNHVNAYTGVALKNDPTIMAWESGNEIDAGSTTINWLTTISQHVKSLAPNHLFIDGGWEMSSQRLAIPTVDMYTRHHYTGGYFGATAITDDQHYGCLAVAANKVYFVGEYDWTENNGGRVVLSNYLPAVETYKCPGTSSYAVVGDTYWSLFPHKDTYGFETHSDGYTLNYIGTGTVRTREEQLINHAYNMNPSAAHISMAAPLLRSPSGTQLRWQGVAGAVYYQIEGSNNGSTWSVISPNLSDIAAPWTAPSFSTYRIRAFNINGVSGPYSSGYNNSNSGPP